MDALSGQVEAGPDQLRINPTTKIVSMNLAGAVFGPGGKIQYFGENEAKEKFFEYTVHILTYCSMIKDESGPVSFYDGWLNTYTRQHYFKDV